MTDIAERLRGTTRAMAFLCSVDMALWNDHSNACMEAAAEIERLKSAIKIQASAARALQVSTMQTVAHLEKKDRSEYQAAATLESEREANAMLTEEIERLRALNAEMEGALRLCVEALGDSNPTRDDYWGAFNAAEAVLAKTEGGTDG